MCVCVCVNLRDLLTALYIGIAVPGLIVSYNAVVHWLLRSFVLDNLQRGKKVLNKGHIRDQ